MTKLLSSDQRTEDSRYCPKCHADWRGTQIPVESVAKGYYGHHAPCEKKREWDDDWNPETLCTCPPQYFSHLVGVEILGGYDGVSLWQCPACNTRWDSLTYEEVA